MNNAAKSTNRDALASDEIPRSFTRRLILQVNVVFLLTMMVFLVISFFGERNEHYNATFAHLEETLGDLSGLDKLSPDAPSEAIRNPEDRLSHHQLL